MSIVFNNHLYQVLLTFWVLCVGYQVRVCVSTQRKYTYVYKSSLSLYRAVSPKNAIEPTCVSVKSLHSSSQGSETDTVKIFKTKYPTIKPKRAWHIDIAELFPKSVLLTFFTATWSKHMQTVAKNQFFNSYKSYSIPEKAFSVFFFSFFFILEPQLPFICTATASACLHIE